MAPPAPPGPSHWTSVKPTQDHTNFLDIGAKPQYPYWKMSTVHYKPQRLSLTAKVPYRLDLFGKKADFPGAAAEFVVRMLRPNNRII